jgi:hypothetical protein
MTAQSFWERRRAAVEAEERAERAAIAGAQAEARAAELEKLNDEAALAELGLPDPSTLGPGDDFAAFMRAGVPEKFKRVALRRLWRSNPVLACIDGLNDYEDDYRQQALGQVVKTAYQVGKGMMAHVEEMQRQALVAERDGTADAAVAAPAPADVPAPDSAPVAFETTDATPQRVSEPAQDAGEAVAEQSETEVLPSARRMRFRFDEEKA